MAAIFPTKLCGPKLRIGINQLLMVPLSFVCALGYIVWSINGLVLTVSLGWIGAFVLTQRNPFVGEGLFAWLRLQTKYSMNPMRGYYVA